MRRSHPGPAVYAIMWSKVAAVPVAPIRLLYSHVGIYSVYSYDGCGLDGVACYTKRSPTATVVGYCRVSTIEIVPPGGGPPGRRAVGVRTAEPLPVRCPRARPGGRRASSRLGAGRERVELEAAGHTTYQRERPSAPVGPLARCANARWPRSDSTSLFAVCWYPRGCEPCVCPRTPETSGTGSGTVRPSPGQYESTSVNDVRRWFPTLAR